MALAQATARIHAHMLARSALRWAMMQQPVAQEVKQWSLGAKALTTEMATAVINDQAAASLTTQPLQAADMGLALDDA